MFSVPNMFSNDTINILGGEEISNYYENWSLAKTSPEMIYKGGLSNEGISTILSGKIRPPKGTMPMNDDYETLTLSIGLSLCIIAAMLESLTSVLTKKLKENHWRVNDHTMIISNSLHIVVIASLFGNMEMNPLNPWTEFSGSVRNLLIILLLLGIISFISNWLNAMARTHEEGTKVSLYEYSNHFYTIFLDIAILGTWFSMKDSIAGGLMITSSMMVAVSNFKY